MIARDPAVLCTVDELATVDSQEARPSDRVSHMRSSGLGCPEGLCRCGHPASRVVTTIVIGLAFGALGRNSRSIVASLLEWKRAMQN